MNEIIPALMPESYDELAQYTRMFRGLVQTVQVDVMDGVFVPSRSWPYTGGDGYFDKIVSEEEGLPLWEDISYEYDLMILSAERELSRWMKAGGDRLIFHIESLKDPEEFFTREEFAQPPSERAHMEFGLAIDVDTPTERLEPFLFKVNFVQFMGIAKIGFQGQPFDERVLHKIREFKKKHSDILVSVDGGVNLESAPKLLAAGANRLVAGSAILKSGDIPGTIEKFKKLERST